LIKKSGTYTRFHLLEDRRTHYRLQAYGFLERIEILPRIDVPNMDASQSIKLEIALYDQAGNEIPIDVIEVCQGVKQ